MSALDVSGSSWFGCFGSWLSVRSVLAGSIGGRVLLRLRPCRTAVDAVLVVTSVAVACSSFGQYRSLLPESSPRTLRPVVPVVGLQVAESACQFQSRCVSFGRWVNHTGLAVVVADSGAPVAVIPVAQFAEFQSPAVPCRYVTRCLRSRCE